MDLATWVNILFKWYFSDAIRAFKVIIESILAASPSEFIAD